MKKLLIAILCLSSFNLQAGDNSNEKKVKSKIKNVTVFLDGAQVHRTGYFKIPRGTTQLVFEGVSPNINPKSIQAKGRGSFTILDVQHRLFYPTPLEVKVEEMPDKIKREIKLLEDSILEIGFDLDEILTQQNALDMEKNILLATKVVKGDGKANDSIPLLRESMEFFREKINDINKQYLKLKRKEFYVKEDQSRMNVRLTELKQYKSNVEVPEQDLSPKHQVVITVSAKATVDGSMKINYMVGQAGWTASYDLRASNTSAPVELTYKANVYQRTGEDWKNVKLKLSTNNPNRGNIKPQLPIWYLNYYMQRTYQTQNLSNVVKDSRFKKTEAPQAQYNMDDLYEEKEIAQNAYDYSQMQENIANVEFTIDLPYSINADGQSHLVAVQTKKLPTKFYHSIVPKMDNEAFIMAKVTDWEKLNLLPASANIFYDGTYIGETMINPTQLSDTLNLSMGRDRSVVVKRTKLKDKDKTKIIGNNKIKTITYELALKNNKSGSINLMVEDQIPVSNNEEIKVSLESKDKADYNDKTGSLKWNLKIQPRMQEKLVFSYSVKYNKDKPLLGTL